MPVSALEQGGGKAQRRTPPTVAHGFVGAVAVNVFVAVVFWLAVTSRYGGDYDDIAYTPNAFEDWLLSTSLFLTIFMSGGIVVLGVQGWRGFGAGLICGVLLVALMGFMWTFVYLVSLGS